MARKKSSNNIVLEPAKERFTSGQLLIRLLRNDVHIDGGGVA